MKNLIKIRSKFLGIYIPTHNREKELEHCLNTFIPQLKAYRFPIYISDNGSTDGTSKMIKRIRHKYPNIIYKNNRQNLGYAKNLISVLRMGATKYALVFSDDDAVVPSSIDIIVENLNRGYNFLVINGSFYDKRLIHKITDRAINYRHDIIFAPGEHERLLVFTKSMVGYISLIVTERKLLCNQIKNVDLKLMPSDFLHTALYFLAVINKKGKFISSPLIKIRSGNDSWKARYLEVALINAPKTLETLGRWYSKNAIRAVSYPDIKSLVALANAQRKAAPNQIALNTKYIR